MEKEFSDEVGLLNNHEKELKLAMDQIQRENGELRKKLDEESQLRIKLQEEIYKNIKTHEEEVQLRLQFESKLNGLHSLHRDLQAKYDRAVEDIYNLDKTQRATKEKMFKYEEELIGLRSRKIENEA